MNKKDFEAKLNSMICNLPLEKQIKTLEDISRKWIPSLIEKKKKNYTFCHECKKYSLNKKFKTVTRGEIHRVPTYRDAGYGDGDLYGDVEYLVHYSICPICGKETFVKKIYVRTLAEYDRRGRKISNT